MSLTFFMWIRQQAATRFVRAVLLLTMAMIVTVGFSRPFAMPNAQHASIAEMTSPDEPVALSEAESVDGDDAQGCDDMPKSMPDNHVDGEDLITCRSLHLPMLSARVLADDAALSMTRQTSEDVFRPPIA